MDLDSARCSREVTTARDFSVGSMSKTRSMIPEPYSRVTWYPASMNTLTICLFSLSTSAVNRRMPRSLGGRREVFQQDRAQAATLLRVLDDKRDLGGVGVSSDVPVIGARGDDLAAKFRDQPYPAHVIGVGEQRHLLIGHLRQGGEVTQKEGSRAHPAVHCADSGAIARARRPQMHDTTVNE